MSKRRRKPRGNPANPEPTRPSQRMAKPAPAQQGSPRILVYALLTVAVLTGLYLHAYAMPQLTYFADGLPMPDARVSGYDAADITALRAALEDDAAGQLNFLHRTAGIIFPVALFLAAWAVFGLLARGRWRWAVVAGAGVFVVVDITESFLIDRILVQDPLQPELVAAASTLTMLSWVLLVVIGTVVAVFVAVDAVALRKGPNQQGS